MRKILAIFLFFLLSSGCATQKISTLQEENCYDYKEFNKFHRCAEKLTKDACLPSNPSLPCPPVPCPPVHCPPHPGCRDH